MDEDVDKLFDIRDKKSEEIHALDDVRESDVERILKLLLAELEQYSLIAVE